MRVPMPVRSTFILILAFATAVGLSACGMAGGLGSGSSGSTGSGGSGGGGSGNGPTAVSVKFFTTPPGTSTIWYAHSALPGLDLKIETSTSGSYILHTRNRYQDTIHFSYDVEPIPPDDTDYRVTMAPNTEKRGVSWSFGSVPAVYVLVDEVRFGPVDSGPYY